MVNSTYPYMANIFRNSSGIAGYLAAFGGVASVTVAFALFHLQTNSTSVAVILLLVVQIVATVFGSRPALFASLLGLWSFNFFFLPPFYTLSIAEPQNWVAFAAFLITAIIVGQLSTYARRRSEESETRRQEIERLYSELKAAFAEASQTEALRQSEQLKSALLDAVTHDLRTPLTSIKASVTTLIEAANSHGKNSDDAIALDEDARHEFLDIINEETDRLNEFIGGIVDLARIEAGKLDLRKTRSDVRDLTSEAAARAHVRLADRHVEIAVGPGLGSVLLNAPSIVEVVYTLLDNAAKYSRPETKIRVRAEHGEGDSLEISVEDGGSGILPELRERVFEKFYRASDEGIHSTAGGLGLGLAIARGIVESQGGTIWVEDGKDGFVTRVVFRIPIDKDENESQVPAGENLQ